MTQFYNPYHFVPCAKPTPGAVKLEEFDKGVPAHVTHAKWLATNEGQPLHHGRLVCKLTPETPLVVGAEQEEDPTGRTAKRVKPFELDGKPAIPGSSLRGLISSVAEAASNSALRVLTNSIYSYRKEMPEALSAMGMIRVTKNASEAEVYDLLPLVLPHMVAMPNESFKIGQSIPEDPSRRGNRIPISHGQYTARMFRHASLKHYFGHHANGEALDEITGKDFLNDYLSPQGIPNAFYRACVPRVTLDENGCIPRADDLHIKPFGMGRDVVLGVSPPHVMPDEGDDSRPLNTLGIVRVLGCHKDRAIPLWEPARNGRREQQGKKHEIFIPWPWSDSTVPEDAWVRISGAVVDRFHHIADSCTAEQRDETPELALRPYHLWKTARNQSEDAQDRRFRLKTGDIVFFRPDDAGTGIAEVSISSIWRGRVETIMNPNHTVHPVTTWDFFARINPNLLPAGDPRKTMLTMAELLFGFVEQNKGETCRALASRVRISNARVSTDAPSSGWYLAAKTLKILGSPKPPSPALYFGPGYRQKNQIAQEAKPNGRKFYLHHGTTPPPSEWESGQPHADLKMKLSATPLRVTPQHRPEFWFHLDFDNLTEMELGCLIYALRPTDQFRHKLGLGKPLGLGTVRIDIAGLFLTDRQKRYAEDDPFSPAHRYHSSCLSDCMQNAPKDRYRNETGVEPKPTIIGELRDYFRTSMINAKLSATIEAVETIGNPSKIVQGIHVQYPQIENGPAEGDHFKWFVRNGHKNTPDNERQYLKPIQGCEIPKLTRHPPA